MKKYGPLFVLVGISAAAGIALTHAGGGGFMQFMHFFMGVALCLFAALKLFNPEGFAKGFAKYDLLTARLPAYGYVYPYIELALGLGYLSFTLPNVVYAATVLVFGFGAVGVVRALRAGLNINCPCMGTALNVPLSTVTLGEDLSMVAMAALMLVM